MDRHKGAAIYLKEFHQGTVMTLLEVSVLKSLLDFLEVKNQLRGLEWSCHFSIERLISESWQEWAATAWADVAITKGGRIPKWPHFLEGLYQFWLICFEKTDTHTSQVSKGNKIKIIKTKIFFLNYSSHYQS